MDIRVELAEIITNELQIDPSRVVVGGQNFEPPADDNIYVVISIEQSSVLGSSRKFDPETKEEVKVVSSFVRMSVELSGRTEDTVDKRDEIISSITSVFATQKQEEKGFRLFRPRDYFNLSFIEGASNLYRFKIDITATYATVKRTQVEYFDKYRNPQVEVNNP